MKIKKLFYLSGKLSCPLNRKTLFLAKISHSRKCEHFFGNFFIYQVYWNLRLLNQFYYSKSANYFKVNWTIKIDGSLHWIQTFTNNFSRNYWIWINFSKNREKEKLRNCNAIKTFWLITPKENCHDSRGLVARCQKRRLILKWIKSMTRCN